MNTDKLKELVDNSELPQLQKNVTKGFIIRAEESDAKKIEDKNHIEKIADEKKSFEVVVSTDEVKIYKILYGKDEWDIKYPYRCIFLDKDGKWKRTHTVSPSLDIAFLVYLEYKNLGLNRGFVEFAAKMLEIKID